MLTKAVLTRPWCLVEINTAVKMGIPVIPLQIDKPGAQFEFPDEAFYASIMNHSVLGESGTAVLQEHGFTPESTCAAIQKVFNRIAVPYSPHRSVAVRLEQVRVLMRQCKFRPQTDDDEQDTESRPIRRIRKHSIHGIG